MKLRLRHNKPLRRVANREIHERKSERASERERAEGMDKQTAGWIGTLMDGKKDRHKDSETCRWTEEHKDGQTYGQMDRLTDRHTGRQMKRQTDRWT